MIGRKKKPVKMRRNPHVQRQKQSSFQYSSNRAQSERTVRDHSAEDKADSAFENSARKAFVALAGLAFIALAAYFSVLSAKPDVVIVNKQPAVRSGYQEAAAQIVGDNFLNHSKLTLNRQKITAEMQSKFPEMSDIDVSTPIFGRNAVVKTSISAPVLALVSGSGTYLINDRGVVLFKLSGSTEAFKELLMVNDQSGTSVTVGKPALTSEQVAYALDVARQSEAKDIPVTSVELVAGGGELNVKHQGLSYIVKYSVYEDSRQSFGTFIASREYADKTKLKPAEYIDVRIPERAYIK